MGKTKHDKRSGRGRSKPRKMVECVIETTTPPRKRSPGVNPAFENLMGGFLKNTERLKRECQAARKTMEAEALGETPASGYRVDVNASGDPAGGTGYADLAIKIIAKVYESGCFRPEGYVPCAHLARECDCTEAEILRLVPHLYTSLFCVLARPIPGTVEHGLYMSLDPTWTTGYAEICRDQIKRLEEEAATYDKIADLMKAAADVF